jgi:hypothetical protein
MNWPNIQHVLASVEQPPGYRSDLLKRSEISAVVAGLADWYPSIAVGNASCYLRDAFYAEKVVFERESDRDVIVFVFKKGDALVGMVSYERDRDSEVLYERVGAVSRPHRGSRLGENFALLEEALGRAMGMGMNLTPRTKALSTYCTRAKSLKRMPEATTALPV